MWPGTSTAVEYNFVSGPQRALFHLVLGCFTAEQALKIYGFGPDALFLRGEGGYIHSTNDFLRSARVTALTNRFDFFAVLLSVIAAPTTSFALHTAARTVLMMRLVTTHSRSLFLVQIVLRTWHIVAVFSVSLFLLMYTYAALAMMVFPPLSDAPGQRVDMTSFGGAMLALFQLGVTNNWNAVMYPNIYACGSAAGALGEAAASLYFVTFFIVTGFVLVNILTASMIDAFGRIDQLMKASARRDNQRRAHYRGLASPGRPEYEPPRPSTVDGKLPTTPLGQGTTMQTAYLEQTGLNCADRWALRKLWAEHYDEQYASELHASGRHRNMEWRSTPRVTDVPSIPSLRSNAAQPRLHPHVSSMDPLHALAYEVELQLASEREGRPSGDTLLGRRLSRQMLTVVRGAVSSLQRAKAARRQREGGASRAHASRRSSKSGREWFE